MRSIPLALTYDDVLIIPKKSTLISRGEANTKTRLTKKINLNIPIVSANMDTVSESEMAIALARLGGISLIHRFMTIEENVEEIKRVKRAQNFMITDPYTIVESATVGEAKRFIAEKGVSGLLVADEAKKLKGVLSKRDFVFVKDDTQSVAQLMTSREKLVVGDKQTTFDQAKEKMMQNKIEKLPLVDEHDVILGLITADDIKN